MKHNKIKTKRKGSVKLQTVITDGGAWDAEIFTERNDCTVRAVAIATGTPYDKVHAELEWRGRRPGQGFPLTSEGHLKDFGFKPYYIPRPQGVKPRLSTVVSHVQKGRFIVQTRAHVFAIVDGVAFDKTASSLSKPVFSVWQHI